MSDAELDRQMEQLTRAQLVEPQALDEYAFRHALTHEAVYGTLLVRERRRFHLAVAEALAQMPAAQSAALAYHYYEAGAWAQALVFAQSAGAKAQAVYAPREAILHFSRALESAAQLEQPAPAGLHRARGQAYETIGDFEQARADFEASLQAGRAAGERRAEWQALVDLGFLWAARDYGRTGEYLRQAVDLARVLGEPEVIAQSLNRLGNWSANVERPAEGQEYHREALAIFESLGDKPGVAATLDLLALASAFTGDMIGSNSYYSRAVPLFRELGDRTALASSLASMSEGGVTYFADLMVATEMTSAEALGLVEEALATARAIGWRAGEVYALINRANLHGTHGEYNQSLADGHSALAIAREIGHQQWAAYGELSLGMQYFELLAYDRGRAHLRRGLALARAVGSQTFERMCAGVLGLLAAQQSSARERAQAIAAISAALGDGAGAEDALPETGASLTLGMRLCWQARADLALTHGKPRLALRIMDKIVQGLPRHELAPQRPPSRIALARASALVRMAPPAGEADTDSSLGPRPPALPPDRAARRPRARVDTSSGPSERATPGELSEGVAWLHAAQASRLAQDSPPLQGRLHVALGRLYRAQGRLAEAGEEFSLAREIVAKLAGQIEDEELRRNYLARALRSIPAAAQQR